MPTRDTYIIAADGSRQLVTETYPVSEDNRRAIEARVVQALAANDAFLAITSPTSADVVTQMRLLTREASAVIRLLLSRLDTTEGT